MYNEAIAWLAEEYRAEIVTLMLDFGQGRALEALRDRALAAGAVRAHVLDVADEFAARFVLPALRAGALHLDGRSSAPGLARMAVAQKLVEIAGIEQTTRVAHPFPAADRRVAAALHTIAPGFTIIALPSPLTGSPGGPAGGGGATPAAGRRLEPAAVELTFVRGVPTAINGVTMPLTDLIGSIDMLTGAMSAAMVLHDAHRGLENTLTPDHAERQTISREYADLIESGAWFTTARRTLDAAVERLEARASGIVRLQLLNDACHIVEIKPLDTRRKVGVRS